VYGQAEPALEAPNVILEKVRVLVKVNRLEGELSQPLSSVGIRGGLGGDSTASKLGACTVLENLLAEHYCENEAFVVTCLVVHG
jgi:hypothetical protein